MMRLKKHVGKFIMAAILLTAASSTIFADQASVMTQKQVNDAMLVLKPVRDAKQKVMYYCDPCPKTVAGNGKTEMINTLNFKDLGKGKWNLLLNGRVIDIAYFYFPNPDKNGKKWKNLARHVGMTAEGVDTYK